MMGDSSHVADGPPGPAIISIDFDDEDVSIAGQESPGNAYHLDDGRRAIDVDDGIGSGDYATGSIWPADPVEFGGGLWQDVGDNRSNTPTDTGYIETQTRAMSLQPTLPSGIDTVKDDESDESDIYGEPYQPTSASTSLSTGHERGEEPTPRNPVEFGEGFWPDVGDNRSNTLTDTGHIDIETQTRAMNIQPTLPSGIDDVNDDEPDGSDIYGDAWLEPHRPTASMTEDVSANERAPETTADVLKDLDPPPLSKAEERRQLKIMRQRYNRRAKSNS